jgi:hypothetical protein
MVETDPMTYCAISKSRQLRRVHDATYIVDVSVGEEPRTASHSWPNALPATLGDLSQRVDVCQIVAVGARVDLGVDIVLSAEHDGGRKWGERSRSRRV